MYQTWPTCGKQTHCLGTALADTHAYANIEMEMYTKYWGNVYAPGLGFASQSDWHLPGSISQEEHSLPPSLVLPPILRHRFLVVQSSCLCYSLRCIRMASTCTTQWSRWMRLQPNLSLRHHCLLYVHHRDVLLLGALGKTQHESINWHRLKSLLLIPLASAFSRTWCSECVSWK